MWVHVPESCLSPPAAAASTAESAWLCPTLARSVMWRSKPRRLPSWERALAMGGWMTRLFGRTPEPSMADAGVERWISSLRATPASPSRLPASSAVTTTPATSGPPSSGSFGMLPPPPSSWKTWADTFDSDISTWSSQLSARSATAVRRQSYSALRRWAQRTLGSECLRSTSARSRNGFALRAPRPSSVPRHPRDLTLIRDRIWSTPTAFDGVKDRHSMRKPPDSWRFLALDAMRWTAWFTDGRGHPRPTTRTDGAASWPYDPTLPQRFRLNPRFWEWMMGWPPDSTSGT